MTTKRKKNVPRPAETYRGAIRNLARDERNKRRTDKIELRLARWKRAEQQRKRRARKRGDQIYMSPGFPFIITAEELLSELRDEKQASHA